MVSAFVVSCVFLVTYVIHKILMRGVHTPFGGEGVIRTIYYTMLISHIILAIVIVPLVLVTLRHAVVGRFELHRRWARWTFPLWYYVSVTGSPRLLLPLPVVSPPMNGLENPGVLDAFAHDTRADKLVLAMYEARPWSGEEIPALSTSGET